MFSNEKFIVLSLTWIFDFVCPGNAMSISHEGLLLLKNVKVNWNLGFDDVCKEKHVKIVYYNKKGGKKFVNATGVIGTHVC